MKFKILPCCLLLLLLSTAKAQSLADSTKVLNEVKIKAYLSEQPLLSIPATAVLINQLHLEKRSITSLTPALNSISGVKMEERSPGSYRLSIRGSLIRSPFGIRNLKIYYDDFPLTDAGGNTYLNLIDQNSIKNIEILKGPDGSLFGANSGGVVIVNTLSDQTISKAGIQAGSFGLGAQHISIQNHQENYSSVYNQAYQRSDGYREQSQMQRFHLQTQQKWRYNSKSLLKFSGFYSDLGYETPGGLTAAQFTLNPTAARLGTSFTPGAIEQQAGIYNKTLFGGLGHEIELFQNLRHVISLYGSYTDFQNPFITNYEKRRESSYALRTYFELQNNKENFLNIQWNLGLEVQKTNSDILNYGNSRGQPTSIIAADRINNNLGFIFNRVALQIGDQFKSEASISLNRANYQFKSLPQSLENIYGTKSFKDKLMPRLSMSYLFDQTISLRAIVSKGYSTPTTAEVRASNAQINPDLEAEEGWNYETGLRFRNRNERFYADLSLFTYHLENAIVRRSDQNDQEFFINAGGTEQNGVELQIVAQLIKSGHRFIKNLDFNAGLTYSDFKFKNYVVEDNDFSGNLLTGVPKFNMVNSLNADFIKNLSLFIQHQYSGKTSLNDAETVFAEKFNLIQLKTEWQKQFRKQKLVFFIGIDNLLNESYSLGNDINAFGNRYYNPAAKRNYFAGVNLKW